MNYVNNLSLKEIVRIALKEDIGTRDITTLSLIPRNKKVKAVFLAKEDLVVCGLHVAALVISQLDKGVRFLPCVREGAAVKRGKEIARLTGRAQSILSAERVSLNFLSLLSGIATKTRKFARAVKPYKVRILDTRKTIPGLRLLEKYAVRTGGGFNHRYCLDEMVMVKDNHLKAIGGIDKLKKLPKNFRSEIEAKDLKELRSALKLHPDIIMLDNMRIADMRKAVRIRNESALGKINPLPKLEASGGITLRNVKKVASTGVDFISVGGLTHSVDAVDISLEIL
ncbi:MAG: carboxylating nicotinate-nucleotide diphosphorylase [Candidatus Omnitrophica bacterium]|nr:carboxylating nicotinate-nucleotide diphosphorylase [Candidatus Omnitrophota bacterium]